MLLVVLLSPAAGGGECSFSGSAGLEGASCILSEYHSEHLG